MPITVRDGARRAAPRAVRDLARRRDVHVRTCVVEDALVADADLWHEPTSEMRRELAPGD
ncbi:hypothetical protein [Curtobacterium sp. VKM Ac-2922]|uniref:hypothetical protein n=1 Tax=Curtobacterium sp. VKM Ac-2922 TaxID=2929475 RepID=UPI001FB1D7D3|nr:hypothetical protein [Curtobacterium sp. VKM Ac-2922]MCJ1714720.1 hypothetical protein [Curtobacterium sp. VKM Ac-2922]